MLKCEREDAIDGDGPESEGLGNALQRSFSYLRTVRGTGYRRALPQHSSIFSNLGRIPIQRKAQ